MANRIGKCTNYASCTLAYKKSQIETDDQFVCPECGEPLQEEAENPDGRKAPNKTILFTVAGVLLAIIIGLAYVKFGDQIREQLSAAAKKLKSTPEPTTEQATATPPATSPEESDSPAATPELSAATQPTEVEMPSATKVLDRNPQGEEQTDIRREVLARVDLIPDLTASERDTLYDRVEKAQEMIKVITIPFSFARSTLPAPAVEKLCEAANAPQLQELVNDPTVVFVVLGFADTQGSDKVNLKLSTERAQTVVDSLRENCRIMVLTQAVGMGSSEFFGEGEGRKNRVAEVWAVLQ